MEFDSRCILKKLDHALLTIFSSTYACESFLSEINNIKYSLRNRLAVDSNSAYILLKVTSYNPNISYLSSIVVVSNATCLMQSDRGPRNSSWQGARSTPVVGLGHHTGDSTN
ncbi:dimer_Tnp_hAT domain-containing protein [Trichonephila clavipes]|nr:dimer_Tnp_hAT domain-containing protein [Trichonephila clavipes]